MWSKQKQQTKTTKHTIEFSNNTPVQQATLPLYSTWSETSNPVRQSITGAVGFFEQTTPVRAEAPKHIDEPAFRGFAGYMTRSISAPRLTRFSTKSG